MASFRVLSAVLVLAVLVVPNELFGSMIWPGPTPQLIASDPNVCPYQKVRYHRSRIVTAYKCCEGFKRVPGEVGCPEELYTSTMNIVEVAKTLGLNKFLKYAGAVSVSKLLSGKQNFTLFAPTDEAFEKLPQGTLKKMESLKWARYFMQYHVVEGKHIAENLKDGMKLSSYEFQDALRVSVSSFGGKPAILIEEATLLKPNQGASNGVIHVIDQVLTPPRHTIMELLERDKNGRFTIMHQIMTAAALDLTGQYTLFAPTDKAFGKVPNETLKKLLDNNGGRCLEALVKNHFIYGYLSLKTIHPIYHPTVHTLVGSNYYIERNDAGEITVDNKRISEKDVRATDGVIHVIDEVLLVNMALDLVSLSEHLNLTEFSKLLKRSNLIEELEGKGPYTVFVPSNKAIEDLSNDVKQSLDKSPQLLRKVVEYHVVKGIVWRWQLGSDITFTTLSMRNKLQVKFCQYTIVSVEGSAVTMRDIVACNGIIHIIDKVLVPPPAYNLLQILDREPQLSFFRNLMTNTTIEALLSNDRDIFTIFAPSNNAIARLDEDKLKDILRNNCSSRAFISRHIVRGKKYSGPPNFARREPYLPGTGCHTSYMYNMPGSMVSLRKCPNHDFKIDNIKASKTDISALNGVIHVIDGVIPNKIYAHISSIRGNCNPYPS